MCFECSSVNALREDVFQGQQNQNIMLEYMADRFAWFQKVHHSYSKGLKIIFRNRFFKYVRGRNGTPSKTPQKQFLKCRAKWMLGRLEYKFCSLSAYEVSCDFPCHK